MKNIKFQKRTSKYKKLFHRSLIVLTSLVFLTSHISIAEENPITSAERQAFQNKIVAAKKTEARINSTIECMVNEEAKSKKTRGLLEIQAGKLHKRKNGAINELSIATQREKGFQDQYEKDISNYKKITEKLERTNRSLHAKEAELRECKKAWFTINVLCDLAGEISGLNGDIRRDQANLTVIRTQVSNAKNRVVSAKEHAKQAREQAATAKKAVEENSQNINNTEKKIKNLKASLARLRIIKQAYEEKNAVFAESLNEAKKINIDSKRRSVIKKLRRESKELEKISTQLNAINQQSKICRI